MPPEVHQTRVTLSNQLIWLCILLMVYMLLAPLFMIRSPMMQVLLIALNLTRWLFLLMVIFIPLEWLLSLHRQPILRPSLLADLGYYFLNGLIPTLFLAFVFSVIAVIARKIIPEAYYLSIAALPTVAQVLIAFAIADFGSYWGHRFMHEVPWLWQYHAIHHEPDRLDWLVNSRAHPIDIIFTRMFGLSLAVVAGFGTPGSASGSLIPQLLVIGGIVWSFLIHANVRLRFGWLEHILSSPHFHHWHHSRDDHPNHNYAAILPIYDRIFGSLYVPRSWPPSYGTAPENQPEVLMAARHGGPPKAEDVA